MRSGTRAYYILLFGWLSLVLWIEFAVDLHLATDGSYYFVSIVDDKWFTDFDWGRVHSTYLTQWLLYLATVGGVTSIPALKFCFAGGIYSMYVLSMVSCLYAVRNECPRLLLFPILSIAAVNLPASYTLYGETQPAALLAWPVLLLLLRSNIWTKTDGVLLCGLAFLWMRTYQGISIAALICALVAIHRFFSSRQGPTRFFLVVFIVIQAFHICTALGGALYPRDPSNAGAFLRSSLETVASLPFAVSIFFLTLIVGGSLWGMKRGVIASLTALGLCFALRLWITHQGYTAEIPSASFSFGYRTAIATVLPLLMIGAILFARREFEVPVEAFRLALLFLTLSTLYQAKMTWEWDQFRELYRATLARSSGYVPVEKTPMYGSPSGWGWVNPMLSVIWSGPVVRSVVLNPENVGWQPYDPREHRPLSKFLRYELP
ncbi:MAG: hypothetical protein KC800_16695 [Candidatus Eremiobacteraeota bacterium]|nr:hypothetical protein [Candidatus Eremiobacteraeota bacterium]